MTMAERKRSANWLYTEKMLLLDIICEHCNIIGNKKTDGVTMKQKNAEWMRISEEFNSQTSSMHRTAENLKAQWDSLKKNAKKVASAARQSLLKTGGGPANPKDDDPLHIKIMALLSTSAVGLYNKFDSDSMAIIINNSETEESSSQNDAHVKDVADLITVIEVPSEEQECAAQMNFEQHKNGTTEVINKDWGDYTPSMLQTPVSKSLRFDEKETVDEEIPAKNICKTPKAKEWSSKRRPAAPASTSMEEFYKKKTKALELQMSFAQKEREEANKLFEIDYEIKKEILNKNS
ncbi:hypothetical protein ACJJTC_015202 [Scirpophaga incertulas]